MTVNVPFVPIARAPLSIEIAGRLREAIVSGVIAADAELPTEAELAESFGVGRSTVREALRIVQAQGLVSGADTVSTARPRVTHAGTVTSAAQALDTALQVGAIPLPDLVDLRVLLEGDAMRAVTEVPPEALALLDAMSHSASEGDVEAFHLADVDLHARLVAAAGNRAVDFTVQALRGAIAGYLREALDAEPDGAGTLGRLHAEHTAIVEALAAGEGERAAELVVAHIRGFYDHRGAPHG